jgi:hypothetical protein
VIDQSAVFQTSPLTLPTMLGWTPLTRSLTELMATRSYIGIIGAWSWMICCA